MTYHSLLREFKKSPKNYTKENECSIANYRVHRNTIVNIFMKSKRDDKLLNGVGYITTTPGNGS